MINIDHFRRMVLRPAMGAIGHYSMEAEQLLLGTALVESNLQWLCQLNNGPALGVFQMEPNTHDDIWLNFLAYRRELSSKVETLVGDPTPEAMAWNMGYAAAMARIHYLRVKAPLPGYDQIEAQARYWKTHYNTHQGSGSVERYLSQWRLYAG